jgi:hypothetical protein
MSIKEVILVREVLVRNYFTEEEKERFRKLNSKKVKVKKKKKKGD